VKSGPFNVPRWRVAFLVFCTAGVLFSADLERLHVNVHTDPDYQSYCAMSERVNCETVAASDFAVAGGLPTAIWGILAYTGMGILAVWGLRGRLRTPTWPFGILFWSSLLSSIVGLVLFFISHFVIHSVCVVCAATYLVNFALLGTAAMTLRRDGTGPSTALGKEMQAITGDPGKPLLLGLAMLVAAAVLLRSVPHYWEAGSLTGPGGLAAGVTADGHPWIGAREPVVEIVEFSDYQCPHCRRGHDDMRALVTREPDRVRLVHRNYPLDDACNPTMRRPLHVEACDYARMAVCAGEQDRFWAANDYIFGQSRRHDAITTAELAGKTGIDRGVLEACLQSDRAARVVAEDMQAARDLGVRGTPTFLLGGEIYPGRIPPDVLEAALGAGAP
jgi:protein-disulfide isomerase/uncharacterized membrane protein